MGDLREQMENVTLTLPTMGFYEDSNGVKEVNISTLAFDMGQLMLTETITSDLAQRFSLILRIMANKGMAVKVFIDCGGGDINAGKIIIDAIRDYPYDIDLYCSGIAGSMAAWVFAGGKKGHRYILPHGRVMIHEPYMLGQLGGSATSIENMASEMVTVKNEMNRLLANFTGQSKEEIEKATAFDHYFDAKEAIAFGLCDKIATGY